MGGTPHFASVMGAAPMSSCNPWRPPISEPKFSHQVVSDTSAHEGHEVDLCGLTIRRKVEELGSRQRLKIKGSALRLVDVSNSLFQATRNYASCRVAGNIASIRTYSVNNY